MIKKMKSKYKATVVTGHPSKSKSEDISMDFRFLLHAPRLVLGKSTFGFWAGFLSTDAQEIHMPVELQQAGGSKIPLACESGLWCAVRANLA